MPKKPSYVKGNYYHIFNRGRSRLSICHQPRDYLDILKRMRLVSKRYSIVIIAYVLLPNHYHYLVRQDGDARASLLPQHIFNSYTKNYNLRYQHSGTLFEGPAKAKLVDNHTYLLHLCRYIHANPIYHGISFSIEEWPYSNYFEWIGQRKGQLVEQGFIETYFESSQTYQQFLFDYIKSREHPDGFEDILDD